MEENEEENKLQIEGTEEIFKACVSNEDVKVSKIVPSLDNIHFKHSFPIIHINDRIRYAKNRPTMHMYKHYALLNDKAQLFSQHVLILTLNFLYYIMAHLD